MNKAPSDLSGAWILGNSRQDLLWIVLPGISGFIMAGLHIWAGIGAALIAWFWMAFANGQHLFATIARTYLDKEQFASRRPLFMWSTLWLFSGLMAMLLSGLMGTPTPFNFYLVFGNIWAYWHVVRQHYGFFVLYQKREPGQSIGVKNRFEYFAFYAMTLAPFLVFIISHPDARPQLGLPPEDLGFEQNLRLLSWLVILLAIVGWIARAFRSHRSLARSIYLLSFVPLIVLVFGVPQISQLLPFELFAPLITFHHDIQYLAIVRQYQKKRYLDPKIKKPSERFGRTAYLLARSPLFYLVLASILSFAGYYFLWWLEGDIRMPGISTLSEWSQVKFFGFFHGRDIAIALLFGCVFHHYYLDQKIWRLKEKFGPQIIE